MPQNACVKGIFVMVRRDIRIFSVDGIEKQVSLEAPFSLASAIAKGVISADGLGESVTFYADVQADAVALSIRNIFLKLGRFSAPCDVLINDKEIGHVDGERISYLLNAEGALNEGSNKLAFRFDTKNDPRDIGIFCAPQIVRFNNALIDKVTLYQKHNDGAVNVEIRVGMIGNTENVRAVATLTSPAGQMYYAGLTRGHGSINIPDPLYWCPHGHGIQNLYKVTVNLYGDVDIEDTAEMKIGLRTVEPAESVDSFALVVNGTEILPMGAVYRAERDLSVPENLKRIDAFITYAAMANCNTVVVPVDSPRPAERFYDLCDMHGIMVIEEIDKISEGYLDTLERSFHHPCVCLLDLLQQNSTDEIVQTLNLAAPELNFSITREFTVYPEHPSLPHTKTLEAAVPKDARIPTTPEMEMISDTETMGKILCGIIKRYPYPRNLESLSYLSQLASANIISETIKEIRLSKENQKRAVFDSLGDCETVASSSAIDSAARRKALGFYEHRLFAPISLYADNKNGVVTFSASSQRRLDFAGTLEYRIADSKNVTIYKNSEALEFDSMSAGELFARDFSDYIQGHENEYYLEYSLREGATTIYSDVLLFVPEKHFAFEDPKIDFNISGSDKRFSITLTAGAFAKDVELYFESVDAIFSENYLNLTQSTPLKITFNTLGGLETATQLKRELKIRSIFDTK